MDDAADAFLRAGASDACNGDVFNVGGNEPISHRDLVELLLDVAGTGRVRVRRVAGREESASTSAASTPTRRSSRATVGWKPAVDLREGLRRTVAFYREHLPRYLDEPVPDERDCGDSVPDADAGRGRAGGPTRRSTAWSTRGWFILGPELEAFEHEFAAASGAAHAVGVGTGTDALALALRALGIGPGDEVITSPLSAAFSALAIMMAGARPVFADIDPIRLTLDPGRGRGGGHAAHGGDHAGAPLRTGRRTCRRSSSVAARHGLALVEDCCQAHLATCGGQPGRHVRRGGGVQLLSDEEPRRARRRRRA